MSDGCVRVHFRWTLEFSTNSVSVEYTVRGSLVGSRSISVVGRKYINIGRRGMTNASSSLVGYTLKIGLKETTYEWAIKIDCTLTERAY